MSRPSPMRANPFVGLRPFEAADAHLFFGRDRQVDELLVRLRTERFVAVLGSSGSGKSSLVRAGLLPALEGGMLGSGGASWRVAILRPGGDPIGNLAIALDRAGAWRTRVDAGRDAQAILGAVLRRGSLGLVEALAESGLPPGDRVLIVVDQFEELFRFKRAAPDAGEDAAAFVKLLLEAQRHARRAIHVVLTMRSEFLGNCSEFRDLPQAVNDGLFLIPRLTRDQLAQAITGPIAVAGARIASSLVQRLLNDVGDDPDQLPVLQHLLLRMWDRQGSGGGMLTLEHYDAVKGMHEALSEHADEAYHELDDKHRRIAERSFRCLTERGPDGREVRRPTPLNELAESTGATRDELVHVLDGFRKDGRSFLTPPLTQDLSPGAIIDISHESLIRQWKRLRDWVNEEAEDRRIYTRVAESAAGHASGQEPLWRDPRLTWADQWRHRFQPTEGWARRYAPGLDRAIAFLDESLAARRAEKRRRQAMFVGVCAFAAVLAGVAWWWFDAQRRGRVAAAEAAHRDEDARKERDQLLAAAEVAEQKLRQTNEEKNLEAKRRVLAEWQSDLDRKAARSSLETSEGQRVELARLFKRTLLGFADRYAATTPAGTEVAALVALNTLRRAQEEGDGQTAAAAQAVLSRHLRALPPIVWRQKPGSATALAAGAGGRLLSIGAAGQVAVWDPVTVPLRATPLAEVGARGRVLEIAPDGRHVVWIDTALRIWDSDSGATATLNDPSFARASALASSSSAATIAVVTPEGTRLWNVADRKPRDLDTTGFLTLAFSPDDRLVAGGRPGVVRVWNTETGTPVGPDLKPDENATPQQLVFSPNGAYLAAATGSALNLWRIGTGPVSIVTPRTGAAVHSLRVNDLAFSLDGRYLATASDDQSAAIVRIPEPAAASAAPGPSGPAATPRPPARVVAQVRHTGSVRLVTFTRGNLLATAGGDNSARVWRAPSETNDSIWPELFRVSHRGAVRAMAFLSNGDLATGDATGWIQTVRVTGGTGSPLRLAVPATANDACARMTRNLTGQEWGAFFPTQAYQPACPGFAVEPVELLELFVGQVRSGLPAAAAQTKQQLLSFPNPAGLDHRRVVAAAAELWELKSRGDAAELFRFAASVVARTTGLDDDVKGGYNNHVCWEGVIRDFADAVWSACVDAVRLSPEAFAHVDSRGVAYALRGDMANALADFQEWLRRARGVRSADRVARRDRWVKELTDKRNPFAPKVREAILAELREETTPLLYGR